jgi:hypothetical protein
VPPGWTGKTHALTRGVAATRGEWLLFTDADTWHDRGSLAACLRYALRRDIVLLSGWPAAEPRSRVGALTDPLCGAVLASWFQRRRTGERRFAPFANGQYLLVRRDAFDRVGGFGRIASRMLEDVALAELMDHAGLPFEVALLDAVLRVQTYAGFADCRRGWARLFRHGAGGNLGRLMRRAVALPFLALAGYAALAVGVAGADSALATLTAGLGFLAVAAMTAVAALTYRQVRLPLAYALVAPLPLLLAAFFLALAARDGWSMRPIEWHGVRYPGGAP